MKRIILVACLALGIAAHVQAQSADAMLQQYRTMTPPQPDVSRKDDQAYVQAYLKERDEFQAKRAELAKSFYDQFPNHEAAIPLMMDRWVVLIQTGKSETMLGESEPILAKQSQGVAKSNILYLRAVGSIIGGPNDPAQAAVRIEEFIKDRPGDPRGGELLYQSVASESDPTKKSLTYRRVLELYPASQAAEMAKGALKRAEAIGKPFELSFTEAITGKPISMKDMKGKVVVIDFWATWCGPCVVEIPHMKELYAQYRDKGVEFIGVSLDQPVEQGGLTALKDFVAKNEVAWPQYYQGKYWQSEFSSSWGINSIPAVFIVDAEGNLASVDARGQLDKMIPELLAKRK